MTPPQQATKIKLLPYLGYLLQYPHISYLKILASPVALYLQYGNNELKACLLHIFCQIWSSVDKYKSGSIWPLIVSESKDGSMEDVPPRLGVLGVVSGPLTASDAQG